MLRVARRLTQDHDPRLVGLVAVVCLLAIHTGMLSMLSAGGLHELVALPLLSLTLTTVCTLTATWLVAQRDVAWSSVFAGVGIWFGHFVATGLLTFEHTGGPDAGPSLMPAITTSCAGFLLTGVALAAVAIDQNFAQRLAKESRRFRVLADATLDGVILERHGQIVDVNRAMCRVTESDASALIGSSLSALIPGIELRLSERGHPVEHVVLLRDGRSVPVEIMWHNGPDAGGRVVVVRDLSREKAAEREIERLAHVDPLTGLLNRDLFEQKMQQALFASAEAATKLAVFYIDLDRFELMNEAVGHRAVEQILIQMAQRLSGVVKETGLVARLGRDAFAIVQPLTETVSDLETAAARVLAEMALPFWVDEQPVAMTASVGVAVYPDDNTDADGLLECAILALCQAKREGNGRWCRFQLDMDQLVQKKRLLGQDLRIALKENQFSLHYQPFVDTATLEVVGYEALLRWDHPKRGRVPPVDFIPLAEDSGLIVPIGSWVLAAACAEAASWDNAAIISVNLSPAQFIQPGIVAKVAEVLRQTGLPPNRLELEITEGTLMDDTQNALRILTSLKGLGVKIAMDDFGTGYSSLSYLRKFPFDKIKIDRSFISDADSDVDAETIVQAIIAMGRSLRLNVTAEGVETREQLAMLRALGCDFVQGYLLGRPNSADKLDLRYLSVASPAAAVSEACVVAGAGASLV